LLGSPGDRDEKFSWIKNNCTDVGIRHGRGGAAIRRGHRQRGARFGQLFDASGGRVDGNTASSTGHAVSNAYHGTVTAMTDTKITAKVKYALHEAKLTEGGDIDVDTVAGVVTLNGTARSAKVSARATRVAEKVEGVTAVKNNLTMATAAK
jgi:osmotically-inducible protein OsmY